MPLPFRIPIGIRLIGVFCFKGVFMPKRKKGGIDKRVF